LSREKSLAKKNIGFAKREKFNQYKFCQNKKVEPRKYIGFAKR